MLGFMLAKVACVLGRSPVESVENLTISRELTIILAEMIGELGTTDTELLVAPTVSALADDKGSLSDREKELLDIMTLCWFELSEDVND